MKRILLLALALFAVPAQAQVFQPITSYTLALTTSPTTASQVIGAQSRQVRVVSTVVAHVSFPISPIVAAAVFLPANEPAFIKVPPGGYVYAVGESSGTLYVTEIE